MRLCAELPTAGSLDVNLETAMLSCIACRCLITQLQLQDTTQHACCCALQAVLHMLRPSADLHMVPLGK
jgi:hypothetical protein